MHDVHGDRGDRRQRVYASWGKRLLDVAIAGPMLAAFAPSMACVSILIRWRMGRPVLFRQLRPGLHGAPFELIKFRTMKNGQGADHDPATDAVRLTPLGRVLRATSFDELPTLWNVLRGEMSLVGPRPLLMQYLSRYSQEQARRHEVKPGITGWAQVRGRNALSWDEKFALDVEYVDDVGLLLDLRILLETLSVVLRRDGVSASGHATMPEFMGSDEAPAR